MPIGHIDMALRMIVAVVLGGLIGYERGRSDHPAGLRTHILVALASATFMLVSNHFIGWQRYETHTELLRGFIHVDPSRIASGVVMGIGFIGGGAIMRTGVGVQGLTTAASLWLVSAIGLAAGSGMYPEAVGATAMALFVLVGLRVIELNAKQRVRRSVQIDLSSHGPRRAELIERLAGEGASLSPVAEDLDTRRQRMRITFEVSFPSEKALEAWLARIQTMPGVERVQLRGTLMGL